MKTRMAALYAALPWKHRVYFRMKWRWGNIFELCESYMPRQGTLLDVGCGTGIFSNLLNLAGPQRNVIGLDLDPRRIATAEATLQGREGLEFRVEALEALQERDVNGVAVIDVIHHIDLGSTHALFGKIYAILKPGGVFVLKDIDRRPMWKFLMNYCLDRFNMLRSFTLGSALVFRDPKDIQAELEGLGFVVERPPLPGIGTCPHALYVCTKK